jgi:hypothetical protein
MMKRSNIQIKSNLNGRKRSKETQQFCTDLQRTGLEKVYFAGLRCRDPADNTINKVRRLFDAAGFSSLCAGGVLNAI